MTKPKSAEKPPEEAEPEAKPAEAEAKPAEPEEKTYSVFIPVTDKVELTTIEGKKFVYGDVNGTKFKVPCGVQTEVSEGVYGALQGVLEALRK